MYVGRHTEARSCNHSCSRRAISITYSECVFVALGIQHAMRICRIVMWPIRLHNIFLHCLINGTIFEYKLLKIKYFFKFSLQSLSEHFSFLEEIGEIRSKMSIALNVKYLVFMSDFNET
jgi:hypothetical protein